MNLLKLSLFHRVIFYGFLFSFISKLSTAFEDSSFPGQADEVHSLPNVNFILNYRHYSGYLGSYNQTFLHYWFFESQSTNPNKDPVVVWFDGGPGCSSLVGAISEAGPLKLNLNGSLIENSFTWNTNANLLFLESPSGVGFSYQLGPNTTQNDNQTAQIHFEALRSFYHKFPHLTQNDFYLTGVSYAGIYIPTLSMLILEQNFPPKFKGIAIGNPGLDHRVVFGSRIHYGREHGLMSNGTWNNIVKYCCPANYRTFRDCLLSNITYESHANMEPSDCLKWFFEAIHEIHSEPRDMYYVNGTCEKRLPIGMCAEHYEHIEKWYNRLDVQRALNIPEQEPKIQWTYCNTNIWKNYDKNILTVREMVRHLLKKNINILLFYGDQDLICNHIGGEWFIDDLNLTDHSKVLFSPWYYENSLAGYKKQFPVGLLYIKVLDAGHFVMRNKPEISAKMFQDFLKSTSSSSSLSSLSSNGSVFKRDKISFIGLAKNLSTFLLVLVAFIL